jgi:hypothetical protein
MDKIYGTLVWKAILTGLVVEAPFVLWLEFGQPAHGWGMVVVGIFHAPSILLMNFVLALLRQDPYVQQMDLML